MEALPFSSNQNADGLLMAGFRRKQQPQRETDTPRMGQRRISEGLRDAIGAVVCQIRALPPEGWWRFSGAQRLIDGQRSDGKSASISARLIRSQRGCAPESEWEAGEAN